MSATGDRERRPQAGGARGRGDRGRRPGGRRGVEPRGDRAVRLSTHPRAPEAIRRAKGWAALAAFCLVAVLCWHARMTLPDVLVRALAAGVVCYLVAWAVAVQVWRGLATAEVRQAQQEVAERLANERSGAAGVEHS